MTCGDTQRVLTAYLDGELDVDGGRAVRGHLRNCAQCRIAAHDESVLRDGLRALPALDPPAQLWSGIRRQLAEAEVVDALRPPWRRALAGWGRPARRLGLAFAGVAIAMGFVSWRVGQRRNNDTPTVALASSEGALDGAPCSSGAPRDVALALASEPACVTEAYAAAAAELVRTALEQRVHWDDARRQHFDVELEALRHHVEGASEGRPRQRAYRSMIRFLQRVTTRDEVLADARGAQ